MPPVGDLQGVRGGFPDRLRAGGGPVPADGLGTGMVIEPGRERLGGAVGKHIHDPADLDVDEDGAVGAALAEGELVDPQHPRGAVWYRRRRQEPEQPGAAGGHPKTPARPCCRTVAQLDCDRPRPVREPGAGAAVGLGQARHLLDERLPGTPLPVAGVPANPEPDDDPPRAQRPFAQAALVRTVHASCLLPTVRAPARPSGGNRLHRQGTEGVADTLHSHTDPVFLPLTWGFTELRPEPWFSPEAFFPLLGWILKCVRRAGSQERFPELVLGLSVVSFRIAGDRGVSSGGWECREF